MDLINKNDFLREVFNDEFLKSPLTFFEGMINNDEFDVYETGNTYELELTLAGFKKENFKIEVEKNNLIISAVREEENKKYLSKKSFYGKYEKRFSLPENIFIDKINARYEDGILKISLPKQEIQSVKMQIDIK